MGTTLLDDGKKICKPPYDAAALRQAYHEILDDAFWHIVEDVHDYTQLSIEALWGLVEAVRYVVRAGIPGDLVECGVYYGGSTRAVIRTLQSLGESGRRVFMYDSFAMFTGPQAEDDVTFDGRAISGRRERFRDVAVANVQELGYPDGLLHVVEGNVEESLPRHTHRAIALLRLDTDTYHSTRAELDYLFPAVSPGGVLIVDDYGHARGARRAVDEYFATVGGPILLNRTSFTCRMGIKVVGGGPAREG